MISLGTDCASMVDKTPLPETEGQVNCGYHHGLIRLAAITNTWLEIWSAVETKGLDRSRCVPDTATAELSCCPSPEPRLAEASIMLLLAPLSCHGRNSKVKKQKGL